MKQKGGSWMEKFSRVAMFLGVTLLSIMLSLSVMALVAERLFPQRPAQERILNITAEGRVMAIPDVGQVMFTVTTEGKDPKVVENENAKKMNAIVDFLKSEGVNGEDIKTSQFSLQPKYFYSYDYSRSPCPDALESGKPIPCFPPGPTVAGYVLSQSVNVKIRNFEKAGRFIAGSIERGASQVGSLVFSVEDPDAYKKKAREIAIRKAKEQAEEEARLLGFRIEGVVSVQEGYSYYPRPYALGGAEGDVREAPEKGLTPPQIEPGSQDVVVTVTVIFKIK